MTLLFSEPEIKAINCIFDKIAHRANKPYNHEEIKALKLLEKARINSIKKKPSL